MAVYFQHISSVSLSLATAISVVQGASSINNSVGSVDASLYASQLNSVLSGPGLPPQMLANGNQNNINMNPSVTLQEAQIVATALIQANGQASGIVTWLLPSSAHFRWVLECLGQAFALPMVADDLNIAQAALSVYSQWILEPVTRPAVFYHNRSFWLQAIFQHLSQLFIQRKVENRAAATAFQRHVDLCKHALRLFVAAVRSVSERDFDSETWQVLLKLLLDITDLLLSDPSAPGNASSMGDELCEPLLWVLFETWLRSKTDNVTLWNRLSSLALKWRHRSHFIVQWHATVSALTRASIYILYGPGNGTDGVHLTVQASSIILPLVEKFTVYAWHRMTFLLGDLNDLPSVNYNLALAYLARIVEIFHNLNRQEDSDTGSVSIPDGNTILKLYGSWLFTAASRLDDDCAEGRAEAVSILCRIFCYRQPRVPFHFSYLEQFYGLLRNALRFGDLTCLVSVFMNCQNLFASQLESVRILIPDFLLSCKRILPRPLKSLKSHVSIDQLRRALFTIISTIICISSRYATVDIAQETLQFSNVMLDSPRLTRSLSHHTLDKRKVTINSPRQIMTVSASTALSSAPEDPLFFPCDDHLYSKMIHSAINITECMNQFGSLKLVLADLLLMSLYYETASINAKLLLKLVQSCLVEFSLSSRYVSLILRIIQEKLLVAGAWPSDVVLACFEFLSFLCSESFKLLEGSEDDVIPETFEAMCRNVDVLLVSSDSLDVQLIEITLCCLTDWALSGSWFSSHSSCQHALFSLFCKCLTISEKSDTDAVLLANSNSSTASLLDQQRPARRGRKGTPVPTLSHTPIVRSQPSPVVAPEDRSHSAPPATMLSLGMDDSVLSSTVALEKSMRTKDSLFSILSVETRLTFVAEQCLRQIAMYFGGLFFRPFGSTRLSTMWSENELEKFWTEEKMATVLSQKQKFLQQRCRYSLIDDRVLMGVFELPNDGFDQHRLLILTRGVLGRFSFLSRMLFPLNHYEFTSSIVHDVESVPFWSQVRQWTSSESAYFQHIDSLHARSNSVAFNETVSIPSLPETANVVALIKSFHNQLVIERDTLNGLFCHENSFVSQSIQISAPDQSYIVHQLSRLFLTHLGFLLPERKGRFIPVNQSSKLGSDLHNLDGAPERECFGVSVFFARSTSDSFQEMCFGNHTVSHDFIQFLESLGWMVDLKVHCGFRGQLDSSLCETMPYFANRKVEVAFHVPYLFTVLGRSENAGLYVSLQDASPDHHSQHQLLLGNSTPQSVVSNATSANATPFRFVTAAQRGLALALIDETDRSDKESTGILVFYFGLIVPATAVSHATPGSLFGAMTETPGNNHQVPSFYEYLSIVRTVIEYNSVAIVWLDDDGDILTLRHSGIPGLILIVVQPLLEIGSDGLYKVQMVVTDSLGDDAYLGPVVDGMIVSRISLGTLVRETAIAAHFHCQHGRRSMCRILPLLLRRHMMSDLSTTHTLSPSCIYSHYFANIDSSCPA